MSGGQRNEMLTAAYYSELGAGSISILTSTIQCFFFSSCGCRMHRSGKVYLPPPLCIYLCRCAALTHMPTLFVAHQDSAFSFRRCFLIPSAYFTPTCSHCKLAVAARAAQQRGAGLRWRPHSAKHFEAPIEPASETP